MLNLRPLFRGYKLRIKEQIRTILPGKNINSYCINDLKKSSLVKHFLNYCGIWIILYASKPLYLSSMLLRGIRICKLTVRQKKFTLKVLSPCQSTSNFRVIDVLLRSSSLKLLTFVSSHSYLTKWLVLRKPPDSTFWIYQEQGVLFLFCFILLLFFNPVVPYVHWKVTHA